MSQVKVQDLTSGCIWRQMLALSWPIWCSMLCHTLFNLVDAIWLGRSSTLSLAAANLSSFPIWIMYGVMSIVTVGTNSLVAQKLGEAASAGAEEEGLKARQEASSLASLGIMAAIVVGLIMALVALIWGRDILEVMAGGEDSVASLVDLGFSYLGLIFLFSPVYCLNQVFDSVLRAYGDTKTPLKAYSLGFVLNAVLDPLFIFGWGPIPRWGVFGAALASNLSFLIVTFIFIWMCCRGRVAYVLPLRHDGKLAIEVGKALWSLCKIGIPPSASSIIFSLVYMAISPLVSHFGPAAVAAIGIGHRLESLSYTLFNAIALACVTMIGQNVGAGKLDRATEIGRTGLCLASLLTCLPTLLFVGFPQTMVKIFVSDSEVLDVAGTYIWIIGLSQILCCWSSVCEGIFSGSGRTLLPACVAIPLNVARIPAAYAGVFWLGFGASGVWWAISLMSMLRGICLYVLFRLGKWKPQEAVH